MTADSPLAAAIAAQMLEISSSNSHNVGDADYHLALRLLEEELEGLQKRENEEAEDARVPRTVPDTSHFARPAEGSSNVDADVKAQIDADREFAEKLSKGAKQVKKALESANGKNKSTKAGKSPVGTAKRAQLPRGVLFGTPPPAPKPSKTSSPPQKDAAAKPTQKKHKKPQPTAATPPSPKPEEELSQLQDLLQILATTLGWTQDWQDDFASTSAHASSKRYREELPVVCSICGDMQQSYCVFTLKCSHRYCVECLRSHIMHALSQPGNELPRCCEPLPLKYAAEVLMSSELDSLMDRRDAHESSKQVSCADCKKDILQESIRDGSAYCVDCVKFTCAHCKMPLHDGICEEDKDTEMLLDTARREGWSKCDRCNHLVELTVGCFHMTCRCGYHFCYLCGKEWKTCDCPSSSEHSVFGRLKEATGKGAQLLRQRWKNPKNYVRDKQQLDEFKQQVIDKHKEKMDLRQSLHEMREEKQWERQVAEQIILLRSEVSDLQGLVDHAEADRRRKSQKGVQEGVVLGEKIVAKNLNTAGKKGKKPSKKGKERARDVSAENDVIMAKIMDYVKT
ncbi:hypothetical protein H072_6897 [Dactylellina haptotyla CBS 200.50]|uniref:RING-type domain-containing protein n=1 Tax=Dactylellina haptotyla (strain CBS 200.50) TaxID=1284197 RepID=S8BVC2_DACHA|nr:hypothetical protein H072_6897 [Dactylellina haptotyla CBS 200.50]